MVAHLGQQPTAVSLEIIVYRGGNPDWPPAVAVQALVYPCGQMIPGLPDG